MLQIAEERIKKEQKDQTGNLILGLLNLEVIPESVAQLTWLRSLNLSGNLIDEITCIEHLIKLNLLFLSDNRIVETGSLKKLTDLRSLYLSDNRIAEITPLKDLINLQSLYISGNRISDIGALKNLINLETLDLSGNSISDLWPLESLTRLKTLDLSDNKISDLSSLLPLIKKGILEVSIRPNDIVGKINLHKNPLEVPPIEIVKQGNKAILQYFDEIFKDGKDYLYEAKLIIVGEGESGKTTLAWKIKDIDSVLPEIGNDRTRGIDIHTIEINNIHPTKKPFQIHVWDFGGQEIYHATHQFFLTKRSLYLIVNNTRSNKTDFNYWLQTISLFSDNSPVIIIQNQVDGSPTDLDLRGLQQFFSNILYVRNADFSDTKDGRLQRLIREIEIQIQQLPHVGSELPRVWISVRNALQQRARNQPFISDIDFYTICKENNIKEKGDIKRLGGVLHDLGVCLFFQNDPILKHLVILQNRWVTKGVYMILDNEENHKKFGHFTSEDAKKIWLGTEFEDVHDELIQLMMRFELCYKIDKTNNLRFVAPQLLPIEKPKYEWDINRNLILYYTYEFMPKGLMGRLIVRLHRYIKNINTLAWRNGCIFEHENTDAQVIETYGTKRIEVRIRGKNNIRLSSIIIKEVDELNEGFEQIKVDKMIPCNCIECRGDSAPHFYEYKNLMNRKTRGKTTIECEKSYQDVSVQQILDGVFDENIVKNKKVTELVANDKIPEALKLFAITHPNEATLLLRRFNEGMRLQSMGQLSMEKWTQLRNEIANGILNLLQEV